MAFRPEIFISAAATEFGPLRQVVAAVLRDIGAVPVEHTDYSVAYGPLQGVLNVTIGRCDAVIHIAGLSFGPEPRERTLGALRRSFAHFEVDVAKSLEKPVFIFLARRGAGGTLPPAEDPEAEMIQHEHRRALAASGEHWTFATVEELTTLIRGLRTRLIVRRRLALLPFAQRATPLLGRERVFAELREAWRKPGLVVLHPPPSRISSAACAGKTALAVEMGWHLYQKERVDFVFFMPDGGRAELEAAVAALARTDALALVPEEIVEHRMRLAAVRQWLRDDARANRFLVIFDAVDSDAAWWAVQSVLPWFERGSVLLTSRRAFGWGAARTFTVGALGLEESVAWLAKRWCGGREPTRPERAGLERLADALGLQPLAIHLAVGARDRETPDEMHGEPVLATAAAPQDEAAKRQRTRAVLARIIAKALARLDNPARNFLHVLATLAPDPAAIPLAIFSRPADGATLRTAVPQLERTGLVLREAGDTAVLVHRFVRELVREAMNAEEKAAALVTARGLLEMALPRAQRGGLGAVLIERLIPHGRALLAQLQGHSQEAGAVPLARALGQWLRDSGRAAEAEPFCRRALQLAEKKPGVQPMEIVSDLRRLAAVLRDRRRFDEAEAQHLRAIKLLKPEAMPGELVAEMYALASCRRAQGRLAEAEEPLRWVLDEEVRQYGSEHRRVANARGVLAGVLEIAGKSMEALPMYRHALKIDEAELGPDHPRLVERLHNLAIAFGAVGWRNDAIDLHRRGLKIGEAAFGAESVEMAIIHKELAMLHEREGEQAEAERSLRRALAIEQVVLGPAHLEVAATTAALGALLHMGRRSADAASFCMQALAIIALTDSPRVKWQPFVRTASESCYSVLHECGASDEDIARQLGKATRELREAMKAKRSR
jgi:tetratricopeptide (TPR) repeat protein